MIKTCCLSNSLTAPSPSSTWPACSASAYCSILKLMKPSHRHNQIISQEHSQLMMCSFKATRMLMFINHTKDHLSLWQANCCEHSQLMMCSTKATRMLMFIKDTKEHLWQVNCCQTHFLNEHVFKQLSQGDDIDLTPLADTNILHEYLTFWLCIDFKFPEWQCQKLNGHWQGTQKRAFPSKYGCLLAGSAAWWALEAQLLNYLPNAHCITIIIVKMTQKCPLGAPSPLTLYSHGHTVRCSATNCTSLIQCWHAVLEAIFATAQEKIHNHSFTDFVIYPDFPLDLTVEFWQHFSLGRLNPIFSQQAGMWFSHPF